jgi:hypothetical protein
MRGDPEPAAADAPSDLDPCERTGLSLGEEHRGFAGHEHERARRDELVHPWLELCALASLFNVRNSRGTSMAGVTVLTMADQIFY